MLSLFFRCTHCTHHLQLQDFSTFPLCRLCFSYLLPAPPLCTSCAQPHCLLHPQKKCLRPWIKRYGIVSYQAKYLILESHFSLFKHWKYQGGFFLTQRLFKAHPSFNPIFQNVQAQAIFFIPPLSPLSRRFYHYPGETLGKWISQMTQLPLMQDLKILPSKKFYYKRNLQIKIAILVDLFLTTGNLIEQAALALHQAGVEEIHVFCLGYFQNSFSAESQD